MSVWISLVPVLALMQAPAPEITGPVIDAAGRQPIAGARVMLTRMDAGKTARGGMKLTTPSDENSRIVTTSEDGKFSFPVEVGGMYAVRVQCAGYLSYGDRGGLFYTVTAGRPVPPIVVELSTPAKISGKVVDDETDQPLEGWSVRAYSWRVVNDSRILSSTGGRSAMTDKTGHYELSDLTPGEYLLQASRQELQFEPAGTTEEFQSAPRTHQPAYYPGVERAEDATTLRATSGATLRDVDLKLRKGRSAAVRCQPKQVVTVCLSFPA
jgi:hypothetical protein